MATRGHPLTKAGSCGPRIKLLGEFTLQGKEYQTVLTISQRLSAEAFPSDPGEKVVVEHIELEDGEEILAIRESPNNGGE